MRNTLGSRYVIYNPALISSRRFLVDFLVVDMHTALPYDPGMVFIETTTFTKLVYEC